MFRFRGAHKNVLKCKGWRIVRTESRVLDGTRELLAAAATAFESLIEETGSGVRDES